MPPETDGIVESILQLAGHMSENQPLGVTGLLDRHFFLDVLQSSLSSYLLLLQLSIIKAWFLSTCNLYSLYQSQLSAASLPKSLGHDQGQRGPTAPSPTFILLVCLGLVALNWDSRERTLSAFPLWTIVPGHTLPLTVAKPPQQTHLRLVFLS